MGRPAIRLAIQLTFELTRPSEDIEHGASARQGLLCAPYTSFLSIRLIVFAGVSWVLDLGICPV